MLGDLYNKVLSMRKDEDYVENPFQMERFVRLYSFFSKMADPGDDKIELDLVPRMESGGITASFIVLHVHGGDIAEFSEVVSYCSAISMDATTDGEVRISCTVPEVFVRKEFLTPEGDGVKN